MTAARVLAGSRWFEPGVVETVDGRIRHVGPWHKSAPDRILAPGFVDLQVNGHDDVDVATAATPQEWNRLDASLAAQGVTTWFPTVVSAQLERYPAVLDRIEAASVRPRTGPRPQVGGVHREGPFLGDRPGAHDVAAIRRPEPAFVAGLASIVRLVTLGPEQPGVVDAIRSLRARGVVVSIGHTEASAEQFEAAVSGGATLVTHLFNAMTGVHHRSAGVAAFALIDDRVACSIIADGHHVNPAVVELTWRVVGDGRFVLVTDAVAWRTGRLGEQRIELIDGVPRLADGTLAGSVLRMDRAVRFCVGKANIALESALQAASTTPARVVGLADRGVLEVGRRADVVVLDGEHRVCQTWVAGELAHEGDGAGEM